MVKFKPFVLIFLLIFVIVSCTRKDMNEFKDKILPPPPSSPTCENLLTEDPWGRVCSVLDISCIAPKKIKVAVAHPPEIDLTKYKSVAFTEIGGTYGEAFSTALKEEIVKNGSLTVVDRTQFYRILEELELTQRDLFNAESRAKLGKQLPATAMVMGNMNKIYEENETRKQISCNKTVNGKTTETTCQKVFRTGVSTVSGEVSIVEVESGAQIQVKHLSAKEEDETEATEGEPDPINENSLHEKNLTTVVHKMAKAIIPLTDNHDAIFYEDSDLPLLKRGILEVEAGELEVAKEIFAKAISENEGNPKIDKIALAKAYFNVGVIYSFLRDYANAKKMLSKAEDWAPEKLEAARMRRLVKCLEQEKI